MTRSDKPSALERATDRLCPPKLNDNLWMKLTVTDDRPIRVYGLR